MNPILHCLRVIDTGGYPISNVTVKEIDSRGNSISEALTDRNGYTVLKLKRAAKQLKISCANYQEKELSVDELHDSPIELVLKI